MISKNQQSLFTPEKLASLFPLERSDAFFDALYGDAEEAAFTIRLDFAKADADRLHFQFRLEERPGKCLACNLTYGLPSVFARHPVINLRGLTNAIALALDIPVDRLRGELGKTIVHSAKLHLIPLAICIQPA